MCVYRGVCFPQSNWMCADTNDYLSRVCGSRFHAVCNVDIFQQCGVETFSPCLHVFKIIIIVAYLALYTYTHNHNIKQQTVVFSSV